MHSKNVPLAGGLALLASVIVTMSIAVMASPLHNRLIERSHSLLGLLLAACIICAVGVVDDYCGLRGRHKLAGQLIAVAVVMSCGVSVQTVQLFGWNLELGFLAVPFTLFWMLGAINSLNLMDGMDGLLSCVAIIMTLAMAIMAVLINQWAMACIAMALAGSLVGFLRYNFPPASIFLGDGGSMLIGLVVGVTAIESSLKGPATVALVTPLALMALPIFDTTAAILRRKLTGRSVFSTDRAHLHHCLLRRGLSPRRVLWWISLSSCVTLVGALASVALKSELVAMVSALVPLSILIVTRLFGYAEFLLLKDRVVTSAGALFGRPSDDTPRGTEIRLQGSADWTRVWQELAACAEEFDFRSMCLDINAPAIHEGYVARWERGAHDADDHDVWRVRIPLVAAGQALGSLNVVGQRDGESSCTKIAALAKSVENLQSAIYNIVGMLAAANGIPLISENSGGGGGNIDEEEAIVDMTIATARMIIAPVELLTNENGSAPSGDISVLETAASSLHPIRKPR